jgi:tyrosinase
MEEHELSTLQSRVDAFLTTPVPQPPVHAALAASAVADKVGAPPTPGFSPFNMIQMLHATELAHSFATLADSQEGAAGLSAVLEAADKATATDDPQLVKHALMLFMTHHPTGNQLKIPALEKRAPQLVLPSKPALRVPALIAGAPSEDVLKYFREDPKANEHHDHWHLVYPWSGDSNTGSIKERQGELFLYMHEQMLARYDAERLAAGLAPVKPLPSMEDYREPIPEGYDPGSELVEGQTAQGQDIPFSTRPADKQMGDLPGGLTVAVLKRWGDNLRQAAENGAFQDGTQVTADLLGATIEASKATADPDVRNFINALVTGTGDSNTYQRFLNSSYGSHHNDGHGFLADIDDPQNPNVVPGVMTLPATAIRDPVFFRWHKHIDDISFNWQEKRQAAYDFSDAPGVLLRKGLSGAAPEHQSPDIILCFKDVILPRGGDDTDAAWQAYGEKNFGGANWDKDFSASNITTGELQTTLRQRPVIKDGKQIDTIYYLYPREFFYFLRVENRLAQAQDVTVRIFLVPTGSYAGIPEVAEDRRKWIEMDKFRYTLQPSQRAVIFQRAVASSVIRKPAVQTFDPVVLGDSQPGDGSDANCDCGWPYNLLLPQGTRQGMKFRLLVMLTDWTIDQVPADTTCGSMSYCGAKDRYPDSRAMGYPFDRPFPAGQSIAQTIAAQNNIATRDITIKSVDSVPG